MDKLSVPELSIDKDGQWYADGLPMIKKEIVMLFASHLKRDEEGQYHVDWQNFLYPVTVEDVPFFVQSLVEQGNQLIMHLYDGRDLPLPPGNIVIKNNIPYVSLLEGCDTKLSRPSYAQLSQYLIEGEDQYLIKYGGAEWVVEER